MYLNRLSVWCKESKFLTGDNDRGWVAKFDWLMANDTNIVKGARRATIKTAR